MALNRLDPEILQFRSEDLGLLGIKTRLLPTGYYKSAEWTAQIAEIHLITDFRPFLYLRNSHPFNYCWKVKRKCVKLTWREINFQVGLTCFWRLRWSSITLKILFHFRRALVLSRGEILWRCFRIINCLFDCFCSQFWGGERGRSL